MLGEKVSGLAGMQAGEYSRLYGRRRTLPLADAAYPFDPRPCTGFVDQKIRSVEISRT